jgi:polyketide synthase 12
VIFPGIVGAQTLGDCIGWGMVAEVGVAVSRGGHVGNILRRNGPGGHAAFAPCHRTGVLLRTRSAEASVADIDWPRWARANPELSSLPKFGTVVPENIADGGEDDGGEESIVKRLRPLC